MSEINDLNIKSQKSEIFERKKLRPWDDPVNFIPSRIFEKTNNNEKNLYNESAIGEPIGKQLVNPLVNSPNVVSSNINNITTTNLPEDFKQIDFSSLSGYGLDESHIIQIYREYSKKPELSLSAEIIQNSIYALAFDLKHNNVAGSFKHSPTVVLTALLKKGQPYSSKTPDKVLNPREEAMQEYIVAQEKRHYRIQELENKTKEFELQEWLKSLPEQELATFAPQDCCPEGMPEKIYQTSRRKKALAAAQEYFITVLWPQKLNELETLKQTPKLEKDVI